MKKKLFVVFLLLMVCTCGIALADYKAGDQVTITVSVNNPNGACAYDIGLSYDRTVFAYESASTFISGGFGGPKGFSFATTNPLPSGKIGTVTFRITDSAVQGKTYTIAATGNTGYDIDDNVVSISVSTSGGSVKIADPCVHNYTSTITKQPTCKEEGVKTFECPLCGDTYTEPIGKSAHKLVENETPPTCGKDGLKITTCENCDYRKEEILTATGKHTYKENTTEPTCGKDGLKVTTCENCDYKKEEILTATGKHTFKENTTEPTCGKDGLKVTTCENCDYKKEEILTATGKHTYNETITKKPTCTDKGEKLFECTGCNHSYTQEIGADGHKPGSDLNRKEPTCTEPGYEYYTCTVCHVEVRNSNLKPTGVHIYEVEQEIAPTCTQNGKRVSKCSYGCGKTKTETLKATGHKMGEWQITTEPTCTQKGVKTRVCTNKDCTKTETQSIAATGHKMGEWQITTEPTCTKTGVKTRVCVNKGCDKTETQTVKALGHSWSAWTILKPATEKEKGERERTCNRCQERQQQQYSLAADYVMTVCSEGIRFRDMKNPITKDWYMFTPIDLSVEGVQSFALIAGNMHKIGQVDVLVQDGQMTVTYRLNNEDAIYVYDEYMTVLPSLSAVQKLDFKAMPSYAYGQPISIEETLGGDTKVLLFICNRVAYKEGTKGVERYSGKDKAYKQYVEQLKENMD